MIRLSSSESQAEQQDNSYTTAIEPIEQSNQPNQSSLPPTSVTAYQSRWCFRHKITTGVLAISILPVLLLGAVIFWRNQLITRQIAPDTPAQISSTQEGIQKQSLWLLLATGTIAGLTGTIAVIFAKRLLNCISQSAAVSTKIVKRLFTEIDEHPNTDELDVLNTNLHLIAQQLPYLLWKQEAEKELFQLLTEINQLLQQSRSEEEVFRNAVEQTRRVLRTDRVAILRLNSIDNEFIYIEESVAPRLPKILWSNIEYIYLEPKYLESYQQGSVVAIGNIYQADLKDRDLGLLERFAVKASMTTPILRDGQLFGLLIAHQCSHPRDWQELEMDLFARIAEQVSFALNHATLLEQSEAKAEQAQQFINLSHQIRRSLNEDDILRTTVQEIRKAIRAERVVVYNFNPDWSGCISAESVLPGWPRALNRKIEKPCIPEHLRQEYQKGRVVSTNNVFEADFHPDHLQLMKQLEIKANLVAPILKDGHLFGLLIAHQCSAPRHWQQAEINLFSQISIQLGFALDHARLISRIETQGQKVKLLHQIVRWIWSAQKEEEIFKITVTQVRKALDSDRVIVYSFDADWYGTVVAEAVVPGFPKALWAEIKDPCFAEGYVEKYQAGRVKATDNIYEAGLTECHLKQLETFAVKANLVAPILKDNQLLGLLIAHQCSAPRHWQQSEIEVISQIATQVGFALERARLWQRVDAESEQIQLLAKITRSLRESLVEEKVLKKSVKAVRKALDSDRVVIYSFDADWYGTIVAEAVLPSFPKALWAEIKDPCFAEGYVEKYQAGKVQATDDIWKAGLTECHLKQLETFAVKANLVAPILKDNKLFGLLIAHQCSAPRHWQPWEINFMTQVALQVGFALDQCSLLQQTKQAYHQAETAARQQSQQKEVLINKVSNLLNRSEAMMTHLNQQAFNQQEAMTAIYEQIQALSATTTAIAETAELAQQKGQQWQQTIANSQTVIDEAINEQATLQSSIQEMASQLQPLEKSSGQLAQTFKLLGNIVSQIKLQGMNVVLESARSSTGGKELGAVAQKVHTLAQQLDKNFLGIKPILSSLQTNTSEALTLLETNTDKATASQLGVNIGQQIQQIEDITAQMGTLMTNIAQGTTKQVETLKTMSQSFLEIANLTNKTSAQSLALTESFNQLKTTVQALNGSSAEQMMLNSPGRKKKV